MEYTGDDLKGDMAKLAADPIIKEWWKHTDPLQSPVPTRKEGEWWASMEEVFHMD
jgi:L-rhamnose mutarotase